MFPEMCEGVSVVYQSNMRFISRGGAWISGQEAARLKSSVSLLRNCDASTLGLRLSRRWM